MANLERDRSHRKARTDIQMYVLAAFCLVLGVALGYLFRGSASPAAETVQASAAAASNGVEGQSGQAQFTPEGNGRPGCRAATGDSENQCE